MLRSLSSLYLVASTAAAVLCTEGFVSEAAAAGVDSCTMGFRMLVKVGSVEYLGGASCLTSGLGPVVDASSTALARNRIFPLALAARASCL